MASTPGFEPRQHWWEASALTTAPRYNAPQGDTYMAAVMHCNSISILKMQLSDGKLTLGRHLFYFFSLHSNNQGFPRKWVLVTVY